MRYIFMISLGILMACSDAKTPITGKTDFQKRMNAEFKDASTSPLTSKDLKDFNGLDFFPIDSTFVVEAQLKRTPDTEWFFMQTTTDRVSKERVYGILKFEIKQRAFQLNVYQSEADLNDNDTMNNLFLPFLDLTNGESTYAGGRYINLTIPDGDRLILNFNEAYNPYCAYNEKYSCPLVPRENFLDIEITAGVRAYVKP